MTQIDALDILKMGHNVYLTGSAGSGKTYVLNQYIHYLKSHGVGVGITASTGIAATHMGGTTIHSWSGIGIKDGLSDYDIDKMEQNQQLWSRFKKTNVLVIDEISMLDATRLDMVDRVCKAFKRCDDPFGGLQIVLCGDFFQLPPISRSEDLARLAYHAESWKNADIKICYLHEQHRQSDQDFTKVLNHIRAGKVHDELVSILKTRMDIQLETATKLYTHNADVDSMNESELRKINDDEKLFLMSSYGKPHLVEALKKSCLAPEKLILKRGAQVMFVKNNFDAGYVNGTLGTVKDFDEMGNPIVVTTKGEKIHIGQANWKIEEDGKIKAEIDQIPLRLAWAITVHKSQGMSLDSAEIDLSRSFVAGQGYVALSRVRTLAGLKLVGFNDIALRIDRDVLAYDRTLKEHSMAARQLVGAMLAPDKKKKQETFILVSGGTITEQEIQQPTRLPGEKGSARGKPKIPTHEVTLGYFREGLTIQEIAKKRALARTTILSHIEDLIELKKINPTIDLDSMRPDAKTLEIIHKAFQESFKKNGGYNLSPVKTLLKDKYSFDELRVARLFLE